MKMKKFTLHNMIQHNRLLRLVMLMIIIGLTIFFYTSYYANSTIDRTPSSQRLHMPSLISVSSILDTDLSNDNSIQQKNVNDEQINGSGNSTESKIITNICGQDNDSSKNPCIKQKVILSDIISSSISEDDSFVQQTNVVGDETNVSYTEQQFLDLPSSSSLSLPVSIASLAISQAKNNFNNDNSSSINSVSSNVMPVGIVAQLISENKAKPEQQHSIAVANNGNTVNNKNSHENKSAVPAHLDTTKGVRTSDLYESGHSEANSDLCGSNFGEHVRLLILITSAPTHHDARLAIRQTWGHFATRRDIAMAFILGATNVQSIEDSLEAESYMYSDIIRGRFIDSYNNLTLKTISSLEWVDTYCSRASFVLKTDDDMFINVQRLMSFIEKHRSEERVIYGRLAKKWKPIRNKRSKYYVSPQQYFPSVFPQFTTGPAYLISGAAIHDLYTKAMVQTYLKLEDVFTTGIVAQLVNVKRIHINEFLNRRIAFNPCNLRKAISIHMVKANEQFDLWKKLMDTNTKCK